MWAISKPTITPWQRIQQSKDSFPYLQYMPSRSIQKRDEHTAYYGIIRPVDDPIWQSIFPPNGFGCRCWIKRLTKEQAHQEGITQASALQDLPKPDFDTNFDRLGALLRIAKDKHGQKFVEKLKAQTDDFMLDLVFDKNFSKDIKVVGGDDFTKHFLHLQQLIKKAQGSRENSLELRKQYAKGENYAAATISPSMQERLGTQTAIVWLSDDTMIKMIAHHPELHEGMLELFLNVRFILKNALKIVKESDLSVVYYSIFGKYYKTAIKSTKDKSELYLTTILKMDEKEFYKDMGRQERKGKEVLEE